MVKMTEEIVKAVKLPVTVKTRLGWDENTLNIMEVAERLQDIGISALSIHGRTRKQLYKGPADWTLIAAVKNNPRIHIPIFGNGDVDSPERALEMKNRYGVDGVMIGRASIGYPWIFREIRNYMNTGKKHDAPTVEERIAACRIHLKKSIEWKGDKLGFFEMRKHYSNYFKGFDHFKDYRMKLVTSVSFDEINSVLEEVQEKYSAPSFSVHKVA
jgi:nifR3 family TIM-barrel protein